MPEQEGSAGRPVALPSSANAQTGRVMAAISKPDHPPKWQPAAELDLFREIADETMAPLSHQRLLGSLFL